MKKNNFTKLLLFMLLAVSLTFSSCERVAPNYAGVLMENYGKVVGSNPISHYITSKANVDYDDYIDDITGKTAPILKNKTLFRS